jgi:hypothetical protein
VFEQRTDGEVWRGFWIGMLMHVIQAPLVYLVSIVGNMVAPGATALLGLPLGFFFPLFIGATQFVYLGPLIYLKLRQQEPEFVKGVWICIGVTILLNSICWATVSPWR